MSDGGRNSSSVLMRQLDSIKAGLQDADASDNDMLSENDGAIRDEERVKSCGLRSRGSPPLQLDS